MNNSSDARFIYRQTSDAPFLTNSSSAGTFNSSITAADPSHQLTNLPGTGLNSDQRLNTLGLRSSETVGLRRF